MKEWIILITVLCLVFLPNIFFKKYLRDSGNELIEVVKILQDNLKGETVNEEDAMRLKSAFYEREKVWILIVDHDMLDEIEYNVEECVALYSIENKKEFESSAYKLIDEIEDLSKREEISLANIL